MAVLRSTKLEHYCLSSATGKGFAFNIPGHKRVTSTRAAGTVEQ